ncbi:hypothetical protein [Streptomyces antibioticus]|uniref:Uncharacterized protein n=1 Tax=Streptomyces antibioticus TaxID=1890 RepID=A0AAE7CNC9_STRAT|nr:hypothetical protein [Streptomyces antibioticus]OOQ47276.1 hypothetical protein AFM16_31540 [Streptomyces antibioticus]QIT47600.1 hypothetical protein HCX60_32095 [Streptomyces antibioticus]
MTVAPPAEGKCRRCRQTRPLFPRKPDHDCIDTLGRVDLIEAARLIAEIEDQGDHWCTRRIEGLPNYRLCVRCFDADAAEEEEFIKEHEL